MSISEDVARNTYYVGTWSGGLIYAVADYSSPYNQDDDTLSSIYQSMLRDIASFRNNYVVDENLARCLAIDY